MTAPGDARKFRTISMEIVGGEIEGVIWHARGGGNKDRISRRDVGERVCAYLEELKNGERVTITFYRHDLTRTEHDELPEA